MAQSDTNRVAVFFSEETTWGETPSTPTMDALPFVSDDLIHNKETVVSETIRSDRMQENVLDVGEDGQGTLDFELRPTAYDKLWEGVLASAAVVVNEGAVTTISTTAPSTYADSGSGFVTAGIVVGMWVLFVGFANAANNGLKRIVTVAAGTLTVTDALLVTEAAGASVSYDAKMIRNGTTKKSYLLEKQWLDITQFMSFTGMRVGQVDLTIQSRQIVTGTWTFMGEQGLPAAATVSGSTVAAASRDVFDASNDVALLEEGGAALTTAVNSITLTVNNNLRLQPAVSNKGPIGVGYGSTEVTGTLEVYFEDLVLLNKFKLHTASELRLELVDSSGRPLFIYIPQVFYEEGPTPTSGQNADVFLPLTFRGVLDPTLAFAIQVDLPPLAAD